MADNEFRVPPADRRAAKQFEPPPWERDAFDELERKKAQEKQAQGSMEPAARLAVEQPAAAPQESAAQPVPVASEPTASDPPASKPVGPVGGEIDEARLGVLMAGLREEEPSAGDYWVVAVVIGFGMVVLGSVLTVWAMAAFVKPSAGAIGATGGSVLLFFGAGFIGGGAWYVWQALKKRGVL